MINHEQFIKTKKYQHFSQATQRAILNFDQILQGLGYIYEGIWREDSPIAGKFEVPLAYRAGRRINLVTLRPKATSLVVEVYWAQDNKLYFEVTENSTQEELEDLLAEIHKLAKRHFCFQV